MIEHYVTKAHEAVDMPDVHAIGVDETSSWRGHDYISLFVDLEAKRLLFATPGKDAKTFEKFAEDLQAHGGNAEAITEVSMDLSPAFQKGAAEHLSNAQITFDRFHLLKLINEAVDAMRKGKAQSQPDLKKSRCLWLKNPGKLSAKQTAKLQELLKNQNLKTAQTYQFRLTFQEIFTIQNRHQGAVLLKAWIENAKASGLPSPIKVAYTLTNHWNGVWRWFESQSANGIIESFNGLRSLPMHKATVPTRILPTIAYLILCKLDLGLPT